MDTRNLIAFGMLLMVVLAALYKGAITGTDVKEVIILLSGGVIGFTVPRRQGVDTAKPGSSIPGPPAAVMVLLVGAVLLMFSCYRGSPPWPGDPTAPPPPFAHAQHVDGGTDR